MLNHPLHPMTVHFPIAFYLLGVGLTVAYLWRGRPEWEPLAYQTFILSGLTAIVSSLFGIIDQNQLAIDDPRRANVDHHITLSIAFMVVNGLLIYLRFRWSDVLTRYRWGYLSLMMVGTGLLLGAGWLGGELVYTLGVGVR